MSHRKVYSQGSVPFSWEHKPGIAKVSHHECPADMSLNGLILQTQQASPLPPLRSANVATVTHDKTEIIPPPPCQFQPPRRSFSFKGIGQQEDPFFAAFKQCSKSVIRNDKILGESKKCGAGSKVQKKSKFIFSCKDSCDVEDDNLVVVRLPNLPPLPRERSRGLIKMRD